MGILDRLRRPAPVRDDAFSPMPGFRVVYADETRFVADAETLRLMRSGQAQRTAQEQFYVLDMLAEEGRATVHDDGFSVPADELARLDDDDASIIGLPSPFRGELDATVHRWTTSPDFRVDLDVRAGLHPVAPDRRGPVILLGTGLFRLSPSQLQAMRAVEEHAALEPAARTEAENVRLVARLQAAGSADTGAREDGSPDERPRLSLGHLDRFTTLTPDRVGLLVEPQADGSLVVEPDLGAGVDHDLLSTRWHQLDRPAHALGPAEDEPRDGSRRPERDAGVVRVENSLVLLGPEQLAGVREVRQRPRIPADQVDSFYDAPGSYYSPDVVDVDVVFSVRVAGLGVIAPVPFTIASSSGIEWFSALSTVSPPEALVDVADTPDAQLDLENRVTGAWERDETVVAVDEQLVDISNHDRVDAALEEARQRIATLVAEEPQAAEAPQPRGRRVTVGMHIKESVGVAERLRRLAAEAKPLRDVELDRLHRTPFPYQRAGVDWMAGLMHAAFEAPEDDPARIQGALLADDMGLGKTFMTLAALAEAQAWQRDTGREPLPVLAVMPVALLENWRREIQSAFGSARGPFEDVVVLQGRGLADYRERGAGPETAAPVDDLDDAGMVRTDRIHASLRVGPAWGAARLDRPGVLVLTTYDTLRRYQVSLGLVEWGVVVFDEAQVTKNPETLATRAAKALKARFKLLATGTPVENSLRDFWCLVDTAQPGLLGTWTQFQSEWVEPMDEAPAPEKERLGRALRDAVGQFMLRREKEDHLQDLPPKHVHEYPQVMPSVQREGYDLVLARHRARAGSQGAALKTLHELGAVSLHPGLLAGRLDRDPRTLEQSARTLVTVRTILDGVRTTNEKAIVFAKTKEVQRALALWLCELYGFRVDIVNGDTAATGGGDSRMARIRAFEARDGFNVIILSPLAVGVGLTVVGANHAIHLERHWNPAKEAQATDRIHRIGQEREVHVHYPVALHPDLDSFDVNLDRLLRNKTVLKDAVMVPEEVGEDLERSLGLT